MDRASHCNFWDVMQSLIMTRLKTLQRIEYFVNCTNIKLGISISKHVYLISMMHLKTEAQCLKLKKMLDGVYDILR